MSVEVRQQVGEEVMVLDLSVFRHERQLLRSQRRLESLRVDQAYDRAERLHRKSPARNENKQNENPSSVSEASLVKDERIISAESKSEIDAGVFTCRSSSISPVIAADDGDALGGIISPRETVSPWSEPPQTRTCSDTIKTLKDFDRTNSNTMKSIHNYEKKSSITLKTPQSYCRKDSLNTMKTQNAVQTELAKWIKSVESLDEQKPLGGKYRTFIPLRVGSKAIEDHSMHDKGWKYQGERDILGKPHGSGEVTFSNGDIYSGQFVDGLRHGTGLLRVRVLVARNIMGEMTDSKVSFIECCFVSDKIEGPGMIEFDDGDLMYCNFTRGVIHGFTKIFSSEKKLQSVCWYQNGLPFSHCWHFCRGGGYLVGRLDQAGNFSGPDLAFLFPDLLTALYGTFRRGRMVSAVTARVRSVVRRENIPSLLLSAVSSTSFSREPQHSSRDIISSRPLLADPYEAGVVRVGRCEDSTKGEGLFLTRSVELGDVLAFYNGVRLTSQECSQPAQDWRDDAYKIMDQTEDENVLDIPPESRQLSQYCASLAHKANHSFNPNAKFCSFYHPRFGLIPALRAIKPISDGTEVLVNYEYSFDSAPPWYSQLQVETMMRAYQQSRL